MGKHKEVAPFQSASLPVELLCADSEKPHINDQSLPRGPSKRTDAHTGKGCRVAVLVSGSSETKVLKMLASGTSCLTAIIYFFKGIQFKLIYSARRLY